ncbi:MAG: hypothetical protein GY822_16680 [Deltaproteobacteria bacterium]|nr:hypothetical protein [Deltaproteobacteria bacterium]
MEDEFKELSSQYSHQFARCRTGGRQASVGCSTKFSSYSSMRRFFIQVLSLVVMVASFGCAQSLIGENPPTDNPVFPTGVAVHPNGGYLAVVSSNFDGRFNRGALLLAPLEEIHNVLADVTDGQPIHIDNPFSAAAYIPTFGHFPVFTPNGERMILATRKENLLLDVGVEESGDNLLFDCPTKEGENVPDCESAPYALSLPGNDPYDLILTSQSESEIRGVVSFLAHHEVMPFTIALDRDGDDRFKIDSSNIVDLGEDVLGVQAMLKLPGTSFVVLAVERTLIENTTLRAIELVAFDLERGAQAPLAVTELDGLVGVQGIRSMAISPDSNSLLVLTRYPDGIVRFDIGDESTPQLTFSGQMETCSSPSRLLPSRLTRGNGSVVDRIFLTCFDDDAVVVIEPNALTVTDEVRFLGEGPFGLAIDQSGDIPLLFVSYFTNHRIGIFHLLDDEGEARLLPKGEIGTAESDDPFAL